MALYSFLPMRNLAAPNTFAVAFGLFAIASLLSCVPGGEGHDRTPKAVFIIVDGIAADVIEKLNPPALEEIARAGGYTRSYTGGQAGTYSQTPTISAVGYNSLLTATWANKHNVWDNDIADPNYHYRNIFRIAEEYNPNLKTAVFSTWTDNRTKLVGEGIPAAGNVKVDYKFDGLELDTIAYPHDDHSDYIHRIDEAVTDEAARYIRMEGPDLSWVYLQYTDDMGHRFGDNEKFYSAVRTADNQIARIWAAIAKRESEFQEDWLLVITTDHGRDAASGRNHGGQSDRERLTWIVTNADRLNGRFHQTPAIVDIMPSICNFMGIDISDDIRKEIDGVPFIGTADFADLRAIRIGDEVMLSWQEIGAGMAEVWIAETNYFREGGTDKYLRIGEVDISREHYSFVLEGGAAFHKILLKGPHHYLNTWILPAKGN